MFSFLRKFLHLLLQRCYLQKRNPVLKYKIVKPMYTVAMISYSNLPNWSWGTYGCCQLFGPPSQQFLRAVVPYWWNWCLWIGLYKFGCGAPPCTPGHWLCARGSTVTASLLGLPLIQSFGFWLLFYKYISSYSGIKKRILGSHAQI